MPPVRCPSCGATLNIPSAQPGQRVRLNCPKCKQVVSARVPGVAAAAPAPASAAPPPAATPPAAKAAPAPPEARPTPGQSQEMTFAVPEPEKPKDRGSLSDRPLPVTLAKLFREKHTGALRVSSAGDHAFLMRLGDIVSYETSDSRLGLLEVLRATRKISAEAYDEYRSQADAPDLAQAMTDAGLLDSARASAARSKGCEELVRCLSVAEGEWRIEAGASGPRLLKVSTDRLLLDVLRTGMSDASLRRYIPDLVVRLRFVQGAHAIFQSLPLTDAEQRLLTVVDGKKTFGEVISAGGEVEATCRSIGALVAFGIIEAGDRNTSYSPPPGLVVPKLAPSPLTLLNVQPAPTRRESPPPPAAPQKSGPVPPPIVPKNVITHRVSAPAPPPPPPPSPAKQAASDFSFVLDIEEQVRGGAPEDMLSPIVAEGAGDVPADAPFAAPEDDGSGSGTGDFVFEAAAAKAVATAGPVKGEVAAAPWIGLPPSDDMSEVVEEVRRLLVELEGKTHHEVLSVSLDADIKMIKRSYFAFAKRYHPDKFFAMSDEDLNQEVDALYTRVTVAFEILKDPGRRDEYELTLMRPPEKSLDLQSEVVQAELKYQEAMAQFNRRELRPALDSAKWAVKLNNDKPKYHALLGRLFLQETTLDVEGAIVAFRRAFELEPKVAMHKVNLGKAYLRGNSVDEAKKCFREAYFLDRDCHEAIRELRLLDKRGDDAEAGQRVKPPAPKKRNVDDRGFFGKLLKKG